MRAQVDYWRRSLRRWFGTTGTEMSTAATVNDKAAASATLAGDKRNVQTQTTDFDISEDIRPRICVTDESRSNPEVCTPCY